MKRKSKNRIGILTCYMGKLPWYFQYFVHSCKYNLEIDFIIVTDDLSYKNEIPINVFFVYKTLPQINLIASQKLGFETQILEPYKLCDFKPVYGLLFSEILKEYEFWGHGDIDIIYGNIRSFITNEILLKYDIIAVRHDCLTGYFLLFRNNNQMNNLFKNSKDYKKVLSNSEHYCFDETNFHFDEFEAGIHYSKIDSEVESMTHVVKKLNEKNIIKAYFDFHVIEGLYGKLSWNQGKLMFKNKYEAILYHLILFKNIYVPKREIKRIPDSFRISANKIY